MAKSINKQEPIIIQGAGLAGSLMALYLAREGYRVEVYERRPDMRTTELYAGKSINLAISVRGLHAMTEVGLLEDVMKMCIPMRGRMVHDLEGNTSFQPYSKDGTTAINSISRGDLNMLLMNEADAYDNIRFHFRFRCMGMDMDNGTVQMRNEATGEMHEVSGQTILRLRRGVFGCAIQHAEDPPVQLFAGIPQPCLQRAEASHPRKMVAGWWRKMPCTSGPGGDTC